MSPEWSIEDAQVLPRILPSSQSEKTISVGEGEESGTIGAERNEGVANAEDLLGIDGPQPSEMWPSDHFMIKVKASF